MDLGEFLEEMNKHIPRVPRHPCRGLAQSARYDGHSCHCTVECDARELDGDDAPDRLHANLPEE